MKTRFERDKALIMQDDVYATEILKERKAELERIESEGRKSRNSSRTRCLEQEYAKRKREYDLLDAMV